ncbi:MAG: hypothetical protein KC468_28280, partial [Myxococcales bacterium]|nr:hypothetical protein [Myxococcales bacterium]
RPPSSPSYGVEEWIEQRTRALELPPPPPELARAAEELPANATPRDALLRLGVPDILTRREWEYDLVTAEGPQTLVLRWSKRPPRIESALLCAPRWRDEARDE